MIQTMTQMPMLFQELPWNRDERVVLMNEMKTTIVNQLMVLIDGVIFMSDAERNSVISTQIRDLQKVWCDDLLSKYKTLGPYIPVLRQASVDFHFMITQPGSIVFSINNAAYQFIAGRR